MLSKICYNSRAFRGFNDETALSGGNSSRIPDEVEFMISANINDNNYRKGESLSIVATRSANKVLIENTAN
ncbi:hypothetical protein CEXT_546521 [Caerostris extrusa]|uniref:Uncharacterized protein n=1 Tax=Caerostris extrusa TaxID=172846 RepID=A0AAV4UHT3_CAEEX|nr:hypothetical protein CEXT_546521 [Caerostris extrusa]